MLQQGSVGGRWCIHERGFPLSKIVEGPLQFFIFAVTIVVVAVPEGLPLAVTISLAYRCLPFYVPSSTLWHVQLAMTRSQVLHWQSAASMHWHALWP